MRSALLGLTAIALCSVSACSSSDTTADAGRRRDAGVDAGPPTTPTVTPMMHGLE